MTSGRFISFPLGGVIVAPDRQRKELRNIEDLAESIARLGLINPITIQRDGTLVAGERRYTACRALGWTDVPAQFVDDISAYDLKSIELEENVKRENLTWQEEAAALQDLHEHKQAADPDWTMAQTAESIGLSAAHVGKCLAVAKELGDERVSGADKLSSAINLVQRSTERRKAHALAGVSSVLASAETGTEEQSSVQVPVVPLMNASFHDWAPAYSGPKFNLIHCDFPYGINVAEAPRQNAALQDHYADGPEVYFALLNTLASGMENVVAESAHLVFWFSMDFYSETKDILERMGWKVNPFPLIWHKSDNSGIAPDPQRWPRRTYETALVASRGDRKLTSAGARSNSFAFPGSRDGHIHISEKPKTVLAHFLSMFCDEYSIVLDPTCGSGNAIAVAEDLGAMSALGLEISPEFYEVSVANWRKQSVGAI